MTTFGISEFNISYFKRFHHSLSQSDVVSAIDNGTIVTTWRSFSSKLYSLYFLSTKNAFQCCPHWKQRVQLSTLHTKVRSYILHVFLFETWFDSGSVGKTTWLGTRRRRTPTSTTPPRGWRGPAWSRHPFQVSPFCSHSVSFVLIRSHLFSFCLMIKLYRRRGGGTCF